MIRLDGVCKKYGTDVREITVLDNITLSVEKGESVAIMGKSGAGKSTLLNLIGCLDSFNSGSYFLNDTEVTGLKDSKLAKIRNQEFGFVMQDFALVTNKTALFNVMLPMYFDNTPMKEMKRKAKEALEKVEMASFSNTKINILSGGEKQRVAIARAIVKNPDVILADEPTGALDSKTGQKVMEVLMEMNRLGIAIIIVTHDEEVADFCKRKIVLSDGKIVSDSKIGI